MLLSKKSTEGGKYIEDYDLVVGMRYGSDGIIPCHYGCGNSCVSASGNSLCGGYLDCEKVQIGKENIYIVKCTENVSCLCK